MGTLAVEKREPPVVYLPQKEDAELQGPELAVFLKNCIERLNSYDNIDVPLVNWHIFLGRAIEYEAIRDVIYAEMKDFIKPSTANETAKKLNLSPPKKKESRKNLYQNNVANETCATNYGRLIDMFYFLAIFPKHPQLDANKNGYVKDENQMKKWACNRIHAIGHKAGVQHRFIHPEWINFEDSPLMKQAFHSAQFYILYPTLGAGLAKLVHTFNGVFNFYKVPAIDGPLSIEFMNEMRVQYRWSGLKAFILSCEFAVQMESLKISKINKIKKEGEKVLKLKSKLEEELGELAPYAKLMKHPLAIECNTVNFPNIYKALMLYKNLTDPKMTKFKTFFAKKTINKETILQNLVSIENNSER